jgi:hypothetical protein
VRIYIRVVYEWHGDELVQTEADSYEYEGPVDLAKGGKAAKNYANLERLYGIQADQAEFLGQTFKGTVAPAYTKFLGEAQDYGSIANQELAAERAGKAASGAISSQQQALEGNLASLGINPADARYTQGMREMGIQGGAQQAAAETTAREGIRDKGFARQQDAISLGMGTPTQASQAANSAANAATANLTAQNQRDQNQAQAASSITQAGMTGYDQYNQNQKSGNTFGGADGGQVTKRGILRLKHGGYVQRLAQGGFAGGGGGGGFMGTPQVQQPPPPGPPPPPTGVQQAGQVAATPVGMQGARYGVGKAAEMGGQAAGSPEVSAFGRGMNMSQSQAAAEAARYNEAGARAQTLVDEAMGKQQLSGPGSEYATSTPIPAEGAELTQLAGPVEAGAAPAAEIGADAALAGASEAVAADAAAIAATETAATAGLTGAAGTAGAALGAAVPALGAGLALYGIGSQAGWWADGGEVTPGSQQQTGEVDGPGGPKDDEILAALSDGEFVMPVGAVKFFGIDRLEKMRQKGLEHEKQMGIA